ncbi:hypothetical protein ACJJIE_01835 [Microbulbifer sp. TRSA001]|uniref:hypothetical protein n=1 Tax=Microbulbifer sp. TRSA001 TaxID=3243381 RepID=UPI0040393728
MKEVQEVGRSLVAEKESNDFCFSHEGQLYRYKKGQVKLLCKANPKLKYTIDKGKSDNRSYHYVFEVMSPLRAGPTEVVVPSVKMASKSGFSSTLATYVPFAQFVGSQDDFKSYCFQIFENVTEKESP